MLNQLVIVGRIVEEPKEIENGCIITLAVPRSYKNEDGEYDTDLIDCVLWKSMADNVREYCKKGDLVGVKGRIQTRFDEDKKITETIAEKVTFLSSGKKDE